MDALESDPRTDSRPDEVKWQVAFFALVPLALGVMTQPVGRVLDLAPEYRFFLRSSPVTCVFDMLLFAANVALHYIDEPQLSWGPFRSELAYRFRDEYPADNDDREDDVEREADVERAILGRWILLILGGVPCQTIKLVVMRGIPLTQITALTFVVPMVLGEVLHFCALTSFRQSGVRRDDYGGCWLLRPHSWWLKTITLDSIFIHEVLNQFLLLKVLENLFPDFELWLPIFLILVIGFLVSFVVLHFFTVAADEEEPATAARMLLLKMVYGIGVGPVIGFQVGDHPFWLMVVCVMVPIVSFLGIAAVPLLALSTLSSTWIGRVLGIPRTALGQIVLHSFLINIIIAVLGYAYVFNGTGTENPSWVGVFG